MSKQQQQQQRSVEEACEGGTYGLFLLETTTNQC